MADMFDHQRAYQTCKGAVAYFDVAPEFAEAEALQLRQLADVVGLYPGVRDYACVSGGSYCVPGDDAAEWHKQATETFPDTRACWKAGDPSCYKTVYEYFSSTTLNDRARRIADAISTWREPAERDSSALVTPLQPLPPVGPAKLNGTQTWTAAELQLPVLAATEWERVPDPSQPVSGRMVLQSRLHASGAPLMVVTPGTVYDIESAGACTDSSKCGGGAPVAGDDVFLEFQVWVDRTHGFGNALLVEGADVCSGADQPCAALVDKAYAWVRVCRQYLQSVDSAVVVTAPSNGQHIRIGTTPLIDPQLTPNSHYYTSNCPFACDSWGFHEKLRRRSGA